MSVKIEHTGNYIILTDGIKVFEFPSYVTRYQEQDGYISLTNTQHFNMKVSYLWTDLVNKNGSTFVSLQDVVDWLRDNTGGDDPIDYFLEVSMGNIEGVGHINKFGRNDDIDTGGFEAIWNGGGEYTGHNATVAQTVEVFSGSTADTLLGTGARTIEIFGLDSNWDEQSEIIIMDGTTTVDTTNSYIRLNRMIVRSAGSGGENADNITARQKATTANIFAVMPQGYNQTMIAAYTIPNGKTGYLTGWYASIGNKSQPESIIRLIVRPSGQVFQVKEEFALIGVGNSYVKRDYSPLKSGFNEKTDIVIKADTNSNNTAIAAGFDLILIDN